MKSYAGKSVLITGGSSGIGLALAKLLSKEGANIWILGRDPQKLEAACLEINSLKKNQDQKVDTIQANIANYEQLSAAINPFLEAHGTPDLLINSAGITYPGEFWEMDLDIYHQMMETNYFGTLNTNRLIVPGMMKRKAGEILNISSIVGLHGLYGYTAYGPSKAAIMVLSHAMRYELKPYNIQVFVSLPSDTDTPQLEFEKQHQKPVMRALNEANNKTASPETVAVNTMNAVRKGKNIIFPTQDSKMLFLAYSLLPGNGLFMFVDFLMNQAWKNAAKYNGQH